MAPPAKPRHRSGYSPEETEQVRSVCLTVAVTLGALMGELCIVGGLVPNLLIDQQIGPDPGTGDGPVCAGARGHMRTRLRPSRTHVVPRSASRDSLLPATEPVSRVAKTLGIPSGGQRSGIASGGGGIASGSSPTA